MPKNTGIRRWLDCSKKPVTGTEVAKTNWNSKFPICKYRLKFQVDSFLKASTVLEN